MKTLLRDRKVSSETPTTSRLSTDDLLTSTPGSSSPDLSAVMAFPRLLASWILLLYWTTSSAGSRDATSSDLSPPNRVKRDLAFETRERVQQSLALAKDVLSVINKNIQSFDFKTVRKVINGLSTIAGLVPGIGSLVAPVINTILVFISQDDPVLNEVKKGFAEVNSKLDSLSIQISNLATDVEWFNYVSVYSQDEVRILNAWRKFNELRNNSGSVNSTEDKLRLAEIFVNYYENTGTEASVDNLYHYLTVTNTSLSGNLNDLLRKKFKCDVRKIGEYNLHFSTLLWRGMLLNQFYWKLIGFDQLDKDTQHTRMIKEVYTAQISAIDHCLDNYERYVQKAVWEICEELSQDDKTVVAATVKMVLDEKYYWNNWVVMVYSTEEHESYALYDMIKVPLGKITVAVGYTHKAEEIHKPQVVMGLFACYLLKTTGSGRSGQIFRKKCDVIKNKQNCNYKVDGVPVTEYVKVMHANKRGKFAQVPESMISLECQQSSTSYYTIYFYYTRRTFACSDHTCETQDQCKELGDSSEYVCVCPDGYRRDHCTEPEKPRDVPLIDQGLLVPDISTLSTKLKLMDDKLKLLLQKP